MNWEALTAVATLLTCLVIAATVFVGIRQLRLTRDTLDHLRRATQLEGVMQIFSDVNGAEFRESQFFIANQLAPALKEPSFRDTVQFIGLADTNVHKELRLMRTMETLATYVRHGLLDGGIIYDNMLPVILSSWEELTDVVRIHRQAMGEGMWENYEWLYHQGVDWKKTQRGPEYLRENWPEPAKPTASYESI